MNKSQEAGGDEFYSALQAKAEQAVSAIFKSPLYTIQYPSQGDFFWNWQNGNNVFNESTFNFINARISPGDFQGSAQMGAAGSFPNAYTQVLNSIAYTLNKEDQAALDQAKKNASQQGNTIVSDYQTTYGSITAEQMKEANENDKLDYIIGYMMGNVWSGKKAAGEPPITYTEMSEARNLRRLLPARPASSDTVLANVAIYLNIMKPALAFEDSIQYGSWVIASLQANAQYPDPKNGGMKTIDPFNGNEPEGYNVGYGINKAVQEISNDLQNKGRTIEVNMETSSASGSELNVSVEGRAGFSIGSWLRFGASGGGSYEMSKVEGTSEDCSVSMKWEGYSIIPMAPKAWQQATNDGWYYQDPIEQATANQGKDISGYKFSIDPPFDMSSFADGGDFGILNNIIIANYPTIEIEYRNADFNSFKESWQQNSSGNLTLFGFIRLGSFSEGVYQSRYSEGSSNSSFKVTFSASEAVVSVPELQQSAYVIGGAFTNPGA